MNVEGPVILRPTAGQRPRGAGTLWTSLPEGGLVLLLVAVGMSYRQRSAPNSGG